MTTVQANVQSVLHILMPKIQSRIRAKVTPIILGITGLQGSGKSTWASKIVSLLAEGPYHLRAIAVSLDDFYKAHDGLVHVRERNPENKLYRTRGQPGTHDEQLAAGFWATLRDWNGEGELRIPSFDKSRFDGAGDRAPQEEWPSEKGKIDVVVFEGWCVGFRPLEPAEVEERFRSAGKSGDKEATGESVNTLADHKLEHLLEVNSNLARYCDTFMGPQHFDFMIHIDTSDMRNVYRWRLQQEHAMIREKGTGMKDEEVVAFVRGYMPAYELYLDGLRKGFFEGPAKRQIRVVLDQKRELEKIEEV